MTGQWKTLSTNLDSTFNEQLDKLSIVLERRQSHFDGMLSELNNCDGIIDEDGLVAQMPATDSIATQTYTFEEDCSDLVPKGIL